MFYRRNDRSAYNRNKLVSFLENERADYQKRVLAYIDKKTVDADPKIALWVRQSAGFDMVSYPEKDGMFAGERKYFTRAVKDNLTPQYDMDILFPTGPAINEKDSTKTDVIRLAKPDKELATMSVRFSQSLSYTKASERPDKTLHKSPSRGMDINRE